jgi:hypothetical protein
MPLPTTTSLSRGRPVSARASCPRGSKGDVAIARSRVEPRLQGRWRTAHEKAAAGYLPAGFSLRRTGSAASLTALPVAVDGRPYKAGPVPTWAEAAKRRRRRVKCRTVASIGPADAHAVRCTKMRLSMVKSADAGVWPSSQPATRRAQSARLPAGREGRRSVIRHQGCRNRGTTHVLRTLREVPRLRPRCSPTTLHASVFEADALEARAPPMA